MAAKKEGIKLFIGTFRGIKNLFVYFAPFCG
jgi:hypothetical protein